MVAFVLLRNHCLGLADPFDVFDHSLLDLEFTHFAVEIFLQLLLLVAEGLLLLEVAFDLNFDVGQFVPLQLLVLVKDSLVRLHLCDFVSQRVDDFISRSHRLTDCLAVFFKLSDLGSDFFDFLEEWA